MKSDFFLLKCKIKVKYNAERRRGGEAERRRGGKFLRGRGKLIFFYPEALPG
jgi:hypothetical protein